MELSYEVLRVVVVALTVFLCTWAFSVWWFGRIVSQLHVRLHSANTRADREHQVMLELADKLFTASDKMTALAIEYRELEAQLGIVKESEDAPQSTH